MTRLPVSFTGGLVVVAALAGCDVEDGAAPLDPELAHEHDEGCGGAMHEPAPYLAMPLVTVPTGTFSLTTLDVGQGDAAIVRTPSGCSALFDGGPSGAGAVIKSNLASLGLAQVDVAFLSHYHADHLGSLDDVELGTDAVPIGVVYDRGGSYTTQAYTTYATQYAGRRVTAQLGQVVDLCGEVTLTVVAVAGNGTGTTNENGLSVAVKISYGAFDALVGGDLTGSSPNIESLVAPTVGEVEVYRVHHHGSDTSTTAGFVDATRPLASFISVGANNSFGHPAPATLANLAAVDSDVWLTEDPATATLRGHIVLVSADGDTFEVTQGATTTTYTSKGVTGGGDTTAPTTPGGLAAIVGSPTHVDLGWQPSTDDTGVTQYLVYRDGALVAQPATTGHADTVAASRSYTYEVAARDAAGNVSPRSAPVTVTTPCDAEVTSLAWHGGRKELTVQGSVSQPSTVQLLGDSTVLGSVNASGNFTFKKKLAARPACVQATAACGDVDLSCF